MRPVIFLLAHFASKRKKSISLLVATTGDTGPAAVKAVGDANNPFLNILVHYPHGQISDFQKRQLTTVESPCVRIATFEGGGDDMDLPIKNIQGELEGVCGVNSYNIGRPLMQMVHFVSHHNVALVLFDVCWRCADVVRASKKCTLNK